MWVFGSQICISFKALATAQKASRKAKVGKGEELKYDAHQRGWELPYLLPHRVLRGPGTLQFILHLA